MKTLAPQTAELATSDGDVYSEMKKRREKLVKTTSKRKKKMKSITNEEKKKRFTVFRKKF